METIQDALGQFVKSGIDGVGSWAPRLLGAFVSLIIGFLIIRVIMKAVSKAFERTKLDDTLRPFLFTLIGFSLKALLIY